MKTKFRLMSILILILIGTLLMALPLLAQDDVPDGYAERFDILATYGDAVRGEELYNTFQPEASFACSTCHHADREDQLIGPGLLNVAERALSRVEGQPVGYYLYESIVNPDSFVVDSFSDALMPENWTEIYTTTEIFDIIAYMLTLEGEAEADSETTETLDLGFEIPSELPDSADPVRGEELFATFQVEASFACSTCHFVDSEAQLIGPGQLNIATRAENRVDGQNAVAYIYTSIVSPDTYLVDGFSDALMPENWADIYTDDDIFDIIAYMLTLEG